MAEVQVFEVMFFQFCIAQSTDVTKQDRRYILYCCQLLLLQLKTNSVTGDNSSEMTNFRSYDTGRLQAAVAISVLIDVFLTLWKVRHNRAVSFVSHTVYIFLLAWISCRFFGSLPWKLIFGRFRLSDTTSELPSLFLGLLYEEIRRLGGLRHTTDLEGADFWRHSNWGLCWGLTGRRADCFAIIKVWLDGCKVQFCSGTEFCET